jgi:hypothetical protein
MSRRDDVLKRAPRLSQVAWGEAHAQRRARPSYVAVSDLYDEESRESATRLARQLVEADSEATRSPQQSYVELARLRSFEDSEATRSPQQSYVELARLRSFDEPTRVGAPRPSYVASVELAPSSSDLPRPAPRSSYVAAKELLREDRCEMETVATHVVRPSYVDEVERVDVYGQTEKFREFDLDQLPDSDEELSSSDLEVIAYDSLAHTDEQPVVEPERLDLDALGRYLFDDCALPPPPEPPRPPVSQAPPSAPCSVRVDGTMPLPAQENPLLPRLAEIQRVMEQRQRALSFLPEEEVRPSSRRPSMPSESWERPWVVPTTMRTPTEPPPMMFGLPTPRPRTTSQSLRPVLTSVACAAVGLAVAALIALVVVFARPDAATQAHGAVEAPVDVPTPVLVTTAATPEPAAPPSFIIIGDPPEEPIVGAVTMEAPSPQAVTPVAPSTPPQKVAAPASAKAESAPPATPTAPRAKSSKSGGKSVEEILAELGEEQLRR